MKKTFILLAAVVTMAIASTTSAYAQSNTLTKGDNLIQAMIGIPRIVVGMQVPALNIAFEHGVADFGRAGSLGVGGSFELDKSRYLPVDVVLEAIVGYHYSINERFDVHAKLGMGYKNRGYSHLSESAFVGITYYFGNHFAVIAETGYSYTTYIRTGIAFRF